MHDTEEYSYEISNSIVINDYLTTLPGPETTARTYLRKNELKKTWK
jgi:hypothetical protein